MMTLDDIQAGDFVASTGDKRVARISGKVIKARRVNLTLETDYFGNPLELKVRRDDLRGQVKIVRDGQVIEVR